MNKILVLLIVSTCICSCNDDLCSDCGGRLPIDSVLVAGRFFNESLTHIEYNPIMEIRGLINGTDSDYYYRDSMKIDLNRDGIDDIQFQYSQDFSQPSCDCVGIDCCMPEASAFCSVAVLTNIQFACKDYYGLNPGRLQVGDTIDPSLSWIGNKKHLFAAWGCPIAHGIVIIMIVLWHSGLFHKAIHCMAGLE